MAQQKFLLEKDYLSWLQIEIQSKIKKKDISHIHYGLMNEPLIIHKEYFCEWQIMKKLEQHLLQSYERHFSIMSVELLIKITIK